MSSTVVSAIVVLGILIFVHELGHFLIAKRARVGVLKFSLGFGPRVWGFKRGETEYLLSAIPLGGYVKMIGEDPKEPVEDPERSFTHKSVWWRSAIVLAGPGANFALAVLIFWGIFAVVGRQVTPPVLGNIKPDSAAAGAGLRPGDRIVALDGAAIARWEELETAVQESGGRTLRATVERDGGRLELALTPKATKGRTVFGEEKDTWDLGARPFTTTRVGEVMSGYPAAEAGLRRGDRIVAFEGRPVRFWDELAEQIHKSPGRAVRLTVEREGRTFKVGVTPRPTKQRGPTGEEEIGLIGIGPLAEYPVERADPFTALIRGIGKTWDYTVLTIVSVVKLVQGAISPKTIGGPILIVQAAGEQARIGIANLLIFTGVLSINLAILNLLPIPILDGGHLLFAAIEIFRGRPVSLKKRELAQQVGLVVLVALMVFAFYNDIFRLLGRQ